MTNDFYEIFNYWKDKAITDDGRVVIDIGYDGYAADFDIDKSVPVITDWGEPRCFACNKPLFYASDNIDDIPLTDLWGNKTHTIHRAQRAHIVPKSLGGKNTADNMFCLCICCHAESPDTIYKSEFFRWVYKRRKSPILLSAFNECIERGIFPLFSPDDLWNASTHNIYYASSSIQSALVGGAEQRNRIMPKINGISGKKFASLYKSFMDNRHENIDVTEE